MERRVHRDGRARPSGGEGCRRRRGSGCRSRFFARRVLADDDLGGRIGQLHRRPRLAAPAQPGGAAAATSRHRQRAAATRSDRRIRSVSPRPRPETRAKTARITTAVSVYEMRRGRRRAEDPVHRHEDQVGDDVGAEAEQEDERRRARAARGRSGSAREPRRRCRRPRREGSGGAPRRRRRTAGRRRTGRAVARRSRSGSRAGSTARASSGSGRPRSDPASAVGSTARLNMTTPSAFGTYQSVSAMPLVTE